MMLKRKVGVVLMTVMALVMVTAVAYALPGIDNFDVDGTSLLTQGQADLGTSVSNFVTSAGNLLGDERDAQLRITSAPNVFGTSSSFVSGSLLSFNNATNFESVLTVQWDGIDGTMTLNTAGLGAQDLTAHGNAIWIRVVNDDLPIDVTFNVYSNGGANTSTHTVILPGGIVNTPTNIEFPFASFTGTANFNSVSAIEMVINGDATASPSVDMEITSIQVSTGTPTAVSLQNVSASSQATVLPFAFGVFGLIVLSTGLVINRKRKNVQ